MTFLTTILSALLQAEPTAPIGAGGGEAAGGFSGMMNMMLIVVMFGVFYFLIIRPQSQQAKKTNAMLAALKKGDEVWTSGGLRGEILELDEHQLTIKIAEKTRVQVRRSHIASVVSAEE